MAIHLELSLLLEPLRVDNGLGAARRYEVVYARLASGVLAHHRGAARAGPGVNHWRGSLLFPVGLVLLVIGLFTLRGRELVAGVVGFGALPEAAFLSVIVTVKIPPDAAPFYVGGALVFGAITVVGLVALVLVWRAKRGGSGPATT